MSIDIADRVKSAFRFGIWSELSNLFRGLAEMMLLLIWYVSLTQGDTLWLEGFIVLSFIYAGSNVMARLLHYFKLKMLLQRLLLFLWILTVLATSSKLLLFNHIDLNAKEFFGQIFRTELTKPTVFGFWVLLFTLI
jgi:hypothetical protein